jgi:hypothetical protein
MKGQIATRNMDDEIRDTFAVFGAERIDMNLLRLMAQVWCWFQSFGHLHSLIMPAPLQDLSLKLTDTELHDIISDLSVTGGDSVTEEEYVHILMFSSWM